MSYTHYPTMVLAQAAIAAHHAAGCRAYALTLQAGVIEVRAWS